MNALATVPINAQKHDLEDDDRDAMHVLPISILPIASAALRRARLVKNPKLESMVELFSMSEGSSGQTTVEGMVKVLGLTDRNDPDMVLMRKVAQLPSFDVYSLRILLRASGITVLNNNALKLSDRKIASLGTYMATFTKPLVAEIFGDDANIGGFTDIISLMRNCPADTIRLRLGRMSEKLGIKTSAIPNFLEDYADIFMSLSYYRQCMDQILPPIQSFLDSTHDIRTNHQLRQRGNLMSSLDMIEQTINTQTANVAGQLESFERSTSTMWCDLTAERFRKIETLIKGYHVSMGGVLCALSVKMNAWMRQFPTPSASGPMRRAEFIMSDMRQGIDRICAVADTAPMLSQLQS